MPRLLTLTEDAVFHDAAFEDTAIVVTGAAEVAFLGCTLRGGGLRFEGDAVGVVRGCTIEGAPGPGVAVAGRAAVVVENAILLANEGPALLWQDEATGEAYGNLCEANAFGIVVRGDAAPRLQHNTLSRNEGDYFARAMPSTAMSISSATFTPSTPGRRVMP